MTQLWRSLGRMLTLWTGITALGGAFTYGLLLLLGDPVPVLGEIGLALRLIFAGGICGLALGWVQARLGGDFWEIPRAWPLASGAGWAFGLPAVVGLSIWIGPLTADLPDGIRLGFILTAAGLAGAASSTWQWTLLRDRLEGALWWLLANAVGWLMAWILVLSIGFFLGGGDPLPLELDRIVHALILGACAGFVVGLEQGIALVGLIAQEAWQKKSVK